MNKKLKMCLSVIFGNFILAICVLGFITPHGVVMGGVTGLSLSLQHYLNVDFKLLVYTINGIVLFAGLFGVSKEFFLSMLMSSITYPVLLSLLSYYPNWANLTTNPLLAAIMGGLMFGYGLGVILKAGAGAGGLDVFAIIINKKIHIPVAHALRVIDIAVLVSQVPFSSSEQIIHGILLILISSFTMNYVIVSGKSKVQLLVISKLNQEILETILARIDVGATLLEMETGYTHEKGQAILIVTSARRVYNVINIVKEIDPMAFMTISNTNEVMGRGFTLDRYDNEKVAK